MICTVDGTIVAARVEQAETFFRRLRGLLYQAEFPNRFDALLISPCNAVHTFGMRFAIDVLFLDDHYRVSHICRQLPPGRISPVIKGARCVLELPSGATAHRNIQVGNNLVFLKEGKVVS